MENKNWKERVMAKKKASLAARGEKFSRTASENDAWLKETSERGGIVTRKEKEEKLDPGI